MTCGGTAPDPLAVFAAAAARTTRILLGTFSTCPSRDRTFPRCRRARPRWSSRRRRRSCPR
jgi:hypothetical protein